MFFSIKNIILISRFLLLTPNMIHTQINKQTHVRSFIHSSSMHTTDTQTNILTKYTIQTLNQIQILHPFQERGRVTQNPIMSSISLVYFISSILLSLLFGLLQFDSLFLSFSLYFIIIIIICNSR